MTYSHEELYQTHYLKEDKENNETKETKEEKERAHKTYEQSRKEFIFLNIVVIGFTVLLGIISYIVPTNKNIKVLPSYLINHILPMIYFTIFSFLFGGIFLLGDDEMRGFLGYFFKDKILNLGIIASYFGIISIIIALCVKHIIQKLIGVKIKNVPLYDILGYFIGRVILLLLIYVMEKHEIKKKDL